MQKKKSKRSSPVVTSIVDKRKASSLSAKITTNSATNGGKMTKTIKKKSVTFNEDVIVEPVEPKPALESSTGKSSAAPFVSNLKALKPKFDFGDDDDPDESGPPQHSDDDDDDIEIPNGSSSGDHDSMLKLLMKTSKYGNPNEEWGRFRWASKRTEASAIMSDLTMNRGRKAKIELKTLMKASKSRGKISSQVVKLKAKQLLPPPLKTSQARASARRANFAELKDEVARYDPIVKEIRAADQLVFPREGQRLSFKIAEQFGTSAATSGDSKTPAPSTALEKEITEQIMLSDENVEFDNRPLTENELAVLKSRNIEEARSLHREIQRRRLLISYQEAKYRRLRRIKSKKYHRILKKERLRQVSDEYEQLVADGTEGAEEKLAELDRLRALERASLKHRTTGKWAKYNKLRAQHDTNAREQMDAQAAIGAELMKKRSLAILDNLDKDDDRDEDEDQDVVPIGSNVSKVFEEEFVAIPANSYNPWISSTKAKKSAQLRFVADHVPKDAKKDAAKDDDNSVERFFARRVAARLEQARVSERREQALLDSLDEKNIVEGVSFEAQDDEAGPGTLLKRQKQSKRTRADVMEEMVPRKVLTTTIEQVKDDEESAEDPEGKGSNKQVNLNLDSLLVDVDRFDPDKKRQKTTKGTKRSNEDVDSSRQDDEADQDDDDDELNDFDFHSTEMQQYLRDAFMDDDVVEDFLREKKAKAREEAEASAGPAKVYLPGWGQWAGAGIRETRKKRVRQTKRIMKKETRLDKQISNAIILNTVDELGAKFKVAYKPASVPDVAAFEARCAKPIGASWNPQTVFKTLTEPKVVTPIGTIIAPMDQAPVAAAKDAGGALKARPKGLPTKRKPLH